jgi:hypothetical protein
LALPDWLAVTVQVPLLLFIVNAAPALVHTPKLPNVTGNPELAVATTVKLPL